MIVFLILLAFGLTFPLAVWSQGGHREAVLLINDSVIVFVLQTDGKIVGAGASEAGFALIHYKPDGSLDPSFGTGGKVTTRIGAGPTVQ
jgi:hypothetical protein